MLHLVGCNYITMQGHINIKTIWKSDVCCNRNKRSEIFEIVFKTSVN